MNNVESVLWLSFLFFVGMLSMYFIFLDVSTSNLSLDNESVQMISKFNTQYSNTLTESEFVNSSINNTGLLNYEGVAPEFREIAEAKGTISTLKNLWNSLVLFPAAMLATMPFINDTAAAFLTILIEAVIIIVGILKLIALYKALRGGNTNN